LAHNSDPSRLQGEDIEELPVDDKTEDGKSNVEHLRHTIQKLKALDFTEQLSSSTSTSTRLNPSAKPHSDDFGTFGLPDLYSLTWNFDLITTQAHPPEISSALRELYASLKNCLDLRDRYISKSLQRLEDDPRNYDGRFVSCDLPPSSGSTQGVRPRYPSWQIYPAPPRPHWEYRDPFTLDQNPAVNVKEEFEFSKCDIPGQHEFEFEMNQEGVFQVFGRDDGGKLALHLEFLGSSAFHVEKKPKYDVPTLREYFMDLDFVLEVISDGPTKSFSFRRLKYLESKWNLYILLNEYQELADMKVYHFT
jgi:hypothetical protein